MTRWTSFNIVRSSVLLLQLVVTICVLAGVDGDEYVPSVYGMQSLQLACNTEAKLNHVRKYLYDPDFDFLHLPRNIDESIDVLVTASRAPRFKDELRDADISYRVVVNDMSKLIANDERRQRRQGGNVVKTRMGGDDNNNVQNYPSYNEMKLFMEYIGRLYPSITSVFSLGQSSEGRELMAVKFSTGGEGKPILLIDAGIHAREWAAPATALYAIDQLTSNKTNWSLFKDIDIYIVPLLNPDGYEYTRHNVTTRLWRKTRSRQPDSTCLGVDANRNFDVHWNTVGAASNACSHLYAGTRPFSEPETRALRDFILARRDRIKTYLSLHSYGNYLLHPWGYTNAVPKNTPTLRCVAEAAASALYKVRGTHYTIGSSTNVLYPAAGGSDDWTMDVAGVGVTYTMELPGKPYGFFPSPVELAMIAKESFDAIKMFARYVNGEICQGLRKLEN